MTGLTIPSLSLMARTPGIAALVQMGVDSVSRGADRTPPNFCCVGPLPYFPSLSKWSGNDNRPPPPEPTDNRGVWAHHPAIREALDRLGEAIGAMVDMHRSGRTWRLRHGLMDLPERESFWHALRAGLEDIADVVAYDEPWAKPELLDALSEAYELAGGNIYREPT